MDHSTMDHSSMDHSTIDHSSIDHGSMGHGAHGSIDHSSQSVQRMDMDHNHAHESGGNMVCSMMMTFHARACERILWNGWFASTIAEFVLSAIAIFLIAFCYEGLKYYREYLLRSEFKRRMDSRLMRNKQPNPDEPGPSNAGPTCRFRHNRFCKHIFTLKHGYQTLLYVIQIIIAYLLMLIFMLFNYWLCLAVVLGMGLGYLCFGWFKQGIEEDDCCV